MVGKVRRGLGMTRSSDHRKAGGAENEWGRRMQKRRKKENEKKGFDCFR